MKSNNLLTNSLRLFMLLFAVCLRFTALSAASQALRTDAPTIIALTTERSVGEQITLSYTSEGDVTVSGAELIETTGDKNVYKLQARQVTVSGDISSLYAEGNALTAAEVTKAASLKTLVLNDNLITTFNLPDDAAIETVKINNNKLESLLTQGTPSNLQWIECDGNNLTQLDLSKYAKLTFVKCENNRLSQLILPKELKILSCSNNQLTALDLTDMPSLWNLRCIGNKIASLDVSSCPGLGYLQAESNALAQLTLSDANASLAYLGVAGNLLNQQAAQTIVSMLPDRTESTEGTLTAFDARSEANDQNDFTQESVSAVAGKNWAVQQITGYADGQYDYAPYAGTTGVSQAHRTELRIYPNPAAVTATVQGLSAGETVCVYTLSGQKASETRADQNGEASLSAASLPAGQYIVMAGGRMSVLTIAR